MSKILVLENGKVDNKDWESITIKYKSFCENTWQV